MSRPKNSVNPKGDLLSADQARNWVRPRVSQKRFEHIKGVAQTARELAQLVGCDQSLAELAGWLHDACKEMNDLELIADAKRYGLNLHPVEERNGHLLHGPIAAELVKSTLDLDNQDLLNAIREHTLGAVDMSLLSKVVFLADCLEPTRPDAYTKPIWKALGLGHQPKQDVDLEGAILVACDLNLKHLLDAGRVIHPKTVEVRNYYLELVSRRFTPKQSPR